MQRAARSFYILTFGCKVNQYESEALSEAWTDCGGTMAASPAEADLILINSCAVTAMAVSDLRQAVRRLHREAPGAAIVITGCAASRVARSTERPGEALADLPGVTGLVDTRRKEALLPFITSPEFPFPSPDLASPPQRPIYPPFSIRRFQRARPVLKVQDGCSHGCAYCIVPLSRGPARSRAVTDVLAEARRLLEAGYAEIMISGINLRQYACHAEGCPDFWALLQRLDQELAPEWAGRARFRLSSVEPGQLDARGLDTLAASRMLCPHLHISLQSGSPSVLQRMGRGHYSPDDLLRAVEVMRGFWPVFGLGADILVGFPGETEAEAAETLAFVRELPLTYAHVFPYSERPGTRAAAMPLAVPVPERKARAAILRKTVTAKRTAFLHSLTGRRCLVALERDDMGHTEWYAPCRLLESSTQGDNRPGMALLPAFVERVEGEMLLVRSVQNPA